ncbi:MAG: phosphate ABC transporter ATP-binding protein [Dehalococcoidales bacterium]|nr:phosphate ABC transporter ATP-binding protein [Dehalococcoidales bacterium]
MKKSLPLDGVALGEKENIDGIKVRNLRLCYGKTEVLKGINMDIPAGKITAIIGPSGCGKTTLLRCINRLSEFSNNCKISGDITLDGQNIFEVDQMLLRRSVGMVFQRPNPFPKSIKENILYGIKATKLKVNVEEVIETSLKKAALWDELKNRLNDNAFALSIGQQQRLCFARSLAVHPSVILLDEPASALDPISTAKLEESIMEMRGEYTQVIVTHNMQEARRISDKVAFMYMGELIEFGETEKIFEEPEKQRTKDYIVGRFG